VEFSESIEQATAYHIDIGLAAEKIESCCFFPSFRPVLIVELATSSPRSDTSCHQMTAGPVVDYMLVDSVADFNG